MADEILPMLTEIAASQAEINLLNIYKGVPLSFTAKIVGFQGSAMRVLTDQHQAVCMFFEKKTFIQSKQLPEIFQADVTELNPTDRVATLANFSRVESGIGNRMLVRVQPKDPLEGKIQNQYGDNIVRGELADISQDGLAIYLPKERFSPRQYSRDASITITLRLPGVYVTTLPKTGPAVDTKPLGRFSRENVRFTFINRTTKVSDEDSNIQGLENPLVSIHGVVVNTNLEESKGRYRVGMRILFNDPSRAFITQFIAQRQSEIIREIKSMYDLLVQDVKKT